MTEEAEKTEELAARLEAGRESLDGALDAADELVHDGRVSRLILDDVSDALTLVESALSRVPSEP